MDSTRFNTCWQYFNPPRRLQGATFNSYIPKCGSQQAALETCRTYSTDDIKTGRGLLLIGTYGTGKTHLTIATVRALMETAPDLFGVRNDSQTLYDPTREDYRGLYCSFFPVMELLDAWRPGSEAKKQRGEWLFHRAKTDDLVVLDDIGAEKATEWTEDRLYAVVDARYRMERATIFTTNSSEKDLLSNGYGKIVSRMFEMTDPVPVTGPDHRRKRA
ncbi:MAG TPA: hypothetical protein DCZ10_18390, partial [Pelotomaculum sp.]|nr:hypothetical protein [Pelotomaculum sp.]